MNMDINETALRAILARAAKTRDGEETIRRFADLVDQQQQLLPVDQGKDDMLALAIWLGQFCEEGT